MFKNFTPYLIAAPATAPTNWESRAFSPCGATEECSVGFINSRTVMIERKVVPADALKRRVDEVAAEIERETGRKPGKKQRADLTEQARHELLPRAFPKRKVVPFMQLDDLMVVGSTSSGDLDLAATLLVQTTPDLAIGTLTTARHPGAAMTEWVLDAAEPVGFAVGREVTLEGENRIATFKGYSLIYNDEIDALIKQGHGVQSLALSYDDRVSFTLTDGLQFKAVKLLDLVFEGRETGADDDQDEADRALWAGELRRLLAAVREALA